MFNWPDLLSFITERQRVIPVIGREFSLIRHNGTWMPLETAIVQRLADDPQFQTFDATQIEDDTPLLPDFLARLLERGIKKAVLTQKLNSVHRDITQQLTLDDLSLPLRQIASITEFPLYLSTATDNLLAYAVTHTRQLGGDGLVVISDSISSKVDLPADWRMGTSPLIYQLFGQISSVPCFALTEEDTLEFMCHLFMPNRRPSRLFDLLRTYHLLFIGNSFPDWLTRFFFRLLKDRRLLDDRDTIEALADEVVRVEPRLVTFLQRYSSQTWIYQDGSVADFVNELHGRLVATRAVSAPAASAGSSDDLLPEMIPGAVFISYAREDRAAAFALAETLEARNMDVWIDRRKLIGGDFFEAKIRRNIERCHAFIPLISRQTEARHSGFVFKEWDWAVQLSRSLPPNRKFFFPLVLDDVPAYEAEHVPHLMREGIHIERALGGVPPESFVRSLITELRRLRASRAA